MTFCWHDSGVHWHHDGREYAERLGFAAARRAPSHVLNSLEMELPDSCRA